MSFRKILLPVDRSPTTEAAVRYGAMIAAAEGAELWLLHVDDLRGRRFEAFEWPAASRITPAAGLPVPRRLVLSGLPARTIVEYADEIEADVILMPTRGHGVLRELFSGSTTTEVLHRTRRAVWTVKKRQLAINPMFHRRRILCGVELGVQGHTVLNHAAGVAAAWNAELVVLHVIPETSEAMLMKYGLDETGEIELVPSAAREKVARMAAGVVVPHELDIMEGDVAGCVRRAVGKHNIDVVIIGRGRSTDERRVGANVASIIHGCPRPVITSGENISEFKVSDDGALLRRFPWAAFARTNPY